MPVVLFTGIVQSSVQYMWMIMVQEKKLLNY